MDEAMKSGWGWRQVTGEEEEHGQLPQVPPSMNVQDARALGVQDR